MMWLERGGCHEQEVTAGSLPLCDREERNDALTSCSHTDSETRSGLQDLGWSRSDLLWFSRH